MAQGFQGTRDSNESAGDNVYSPLWIIGAIPAAICVAAAAYHLFQAITLPIPCRLDSAFRQAIVWVEAV